MFARNGGFWVPTARKAGSTPASLFEACLLQGFPSMLFWCLSMSCKVILLNSAANSCIMHLLVYVFNTLLPYLSRTDSKQVLKLYMWIKYIYIYVHMTYIYMSKHKSEIDSRVIYCHPFSWTICSLLRRFLYESHLNKGKMEKYCSKHFYGADLVLISKYFVNGGIRSLEGLWT